MTKAAAVQETVTQTEVDTATGEIMNEQQLVVTSEGALVVPAAQTLSEMFLNNATNYISSIVDDGTIAKKGLIYNAMNDNDGSVADLAEAKDSIVVTDFMAYPVQIVTENGNLIDSVRVVLVTDNGMTYGTVATGVMSSMQKLVGVCGMAPWNPGLKITPVRKKTRSGFYTMVLRLAAE